MPKVSAVYPLISRVARRCRSAFGIAGAREVAPPPALVVLELTPAGGALRPANAVSCDAAGAERSLACGACSIVDWGAVIASVPPGARVLLAGDPLDSPDFEEILFEADRRDLRVTVETAGERLEEFAPVIFGLDAAAVRIRLHGPEDVHNAAAGSGRAFSEAARGVIALKALSADVRRPALTADIAISAANHARLEETVESALAIGVGEVSVRHAAPGAASGESYGVFDVTALKAQVRRIHDRRPDGVRFVPSLFDEEIDRYYTGASQQIGPKRCFVPWRSMTIGSDGSMRLCDAGALGAFAGKPLDEAFNGPEARTIRRNMRGGLAPGCANCVRRFAGEEL